MAGALDRPGQLALVLGASTRLPARADLSALGDEAAQLFCLLVVNFHRMIGAKQADAGLGIKPARPTTSVRGIVVIHIHSVSYSYFMVLVLSDKLSSRLEWEFILFNRLGFRGGCFS
jgi:hypothetical protein